MVELAEILRRFGARFRERFGSWLPFAQRRAMRDIEACRTARLGGQLYQCPECRTERYSYHSCKNRHCPKCQNEKARQWLEQQRSLLLPVPYFLLTATLAGATAPAGEEAAQDDLQPAVSKRHRGIAHAHPRPQVPRRGAAGRHRHPAHLEARSAVPSAHPLSRDRRRADPGREKVARHEQHLPGQRGGLRDNLSRQVPRRPRKGRPCSTGSIPRSGARTGSSTSFPSATACPP